MNWIKMISEYFLDFRLKIDCLSDVLKQNDETWGRGMKQEDDVIIIDEQLL